MCIFLVIESVACVWKEKNNWKNKTRTSRVGREEEKRTAIASKLVNSIDEAAVKVGSPLKPRSLRSDVLSHSYLVALSHLFGFLLLLRLLLLLPSFSRLLLILFLLQISEFLMEWKRSQDEMMRNGDRINGPFMGSERRRRIAYCRDFEHSNVDKVAEVRMDHSD